MDLKQVWSHFMEYLLENDEIRNAWRKDVTGIPFLYVQLQKDTEAEVLLTHIKKAAGRSMEGKRLHSETIYVRAEPPLYVFRHRFYVPREKMFCCGNVCVDCILLRGNSFYPQKKA